MHEQTASTVVDPTYDFGLFVCYYTAGGDKKELNAKRTELRRVDENLWTALMNFINAPGGNDQVSKMRRAKATKAFTEAFAEMKKRQREQVASQVKTVAERTPRAATG